MDEIPEIARRVGCAIFVVPDEVEVAIRNALILAPEDKSVITIEQVREIEQRLMVRQTSDVFVMVRPADKLGLDAANAFLKNLEEPGERVHFLLVTAAPSMLLPTILSRAQVYFLRRTVDFSAGISADDKTKALAKRLMTAKGAELVTVAEEIAKKKDGARAHALNVLATAIEMLYKSYFLTEKEAFLKRMPGFLAAYEAISGNGHIKLHLVAELA